MPQQWQTPCCDFLVVKTITVGWAGLMLPPPQIPKSVSQLVLWTHIPHSFQLYTLPDVWNNHRCQGGFVTKDSIPAYRVIDTLEYFWQTAPAGHTTGSGCERLTGFMPAVYQPSSWLTKWRSLMASPKPDQKDLLGISMDSIHLQKSGAETRSNALARRRKYSCHWASVTMPATASQQQPCSDVLRTLWKPGMHWFKNDCSHGGLRCLHPLFPPMLLKMLNAVCGENKIVSTFLTFPTQPSMLQVIHRMHFSNNFVFCR